MTLARFNKFYLAAAAFVAVLVSNGMLGGEAAAWATSISAGIGAALVVLVPNADPEYVDPDEGPLSDLDPEPGEHRAP